MEGNKFIFIQQISMVGVMLILFISEKWKNSLKGIHKDLVKTGAGGQFGNKGGVTIRVNIFQSSLCFVSSHLAAGESKVKERVEDFMMIHSKAFQQNKESVKNEYEIEFSDYRFFFGDLNFRIDGNFSSIYDVVTKELN